MKTILKKKIPVFLALICFSVMCFFSLNTTTFADNTVYYGDVNLSGNITAADATAILKHTAGIQKLTYAYSLKLADVNRDGKVNAKDAAAILRIAAGLDKPVFYTESSDYETGVLVAYFSRTGTTRDVARLIRNETGGDTFEIIPESAYPQRYNDVLDIAQSELDSNARPRISGNVSNIENYDTVFVGFPIWHGNEPMIIRTFLESYDFDGKTVVPFCTSGGSGISSAQDSFEYMLPRSIVPDGLCLPSSAQNRSQTVKDWLAKIMPQSEPDNSEDHDLRIFIRDKSFTADFEENSSADALKELLEEGPLTIKMSDYGNFEKVGSIGTTLPRNDEQTTTVAGDIILYQGDSLVIYYDTNSWNFTRIGKINNATQEELKEALGDGDVTVTFSLIKQGAQIV